MTKQKRAATSAKKAKAKAKPAIPVAGERRPAETLDDMAAALDGVVPAAPKKKGASKARITLDLTDDVQSLVEKYVEQKTVFDLVNKPLESTKKEAARAVLNPFVELWFSQGSVPQNPTLYTYREDGVIDHQCMFQLTNRFYPDIDMSYEEGSPPPTAQMLAAQCIKTLTDCGMGEAEATGFVENELDLVPLRGLHSFNRLSKGRKEGQVWIEATDAEKSVAGKLLKVVLGQEIEPFTEHDRKIAVFIEPNCQVAPGVFQRVNTYAKSIDDILAMLALLNPVYFLAKAKFCVNETPVSYNERLVGVVSDLIGIDAE